MLVGKLDPIHGSTISSEGLLAYLSQIILSKTDEEIARKEGILNEKQVILKNAQDGMKSVRDALLKVTLEKKRLLTLNRVLKLISTLKREGVLVGNNRAKIAQILKTIHDQHLSNLKSLEERLMLYLPESIKISNS